MARSFVSSRRVDIRTSGDAVVPQWVGPCLHATEVVREHGAEPASVQSQPVCVMVSDRVVRMCSEERNTVTGLPEPGGLPWGGAVGADIQRIKERQP